MNNKEQENFEIDVLDQAWMIQQEASQLGFDWTEITPVLAKIDEELAEIREALEQGNREHAADELGDLLFAAVNVARFLGCHPSKSLQNTNNRFKARFARVREIAEQRGLSLPSCSLRTLDEIWEEVKVQERQGLEEGG